MFNSKCKGTVTKFIEKPLIQTLSIDCKLKASNGAITLLQFESAYSTLHWRPGTSLFTCLSKIANSIAGRTFPMENSREFSRGSIMAIRNSVDQLPAEGTWLSCSSSDRSTPNVLPGLRRSRTSFEHDADGSRNNSISISTTIVTLRQVVVIAVVVVANSRSSGSFPIRFPIVLRSSSILLRRNANE